MTNSRIVREPAPTDELPLRCLSMGSSLWARAMRLEDARLPTVLIEEARDPLPASLPERAALADSYDVLLVDAEGLSRVETGALAEWARVPVVLLCDAATDADALLQAGAWAVLPRDGVTGRWLHFALASAVRGFDRERKRRRQPLDGEEILRAVLKETGHFLAHIDLDMRYTWYLNPQFPEEAGQFMGRRIGEPMPGPEADKLRALVRYVMETGNPGHVDFHFTESPAAPGRWFDLVVRPTVDGAGEVDGALLLAMEISGYRRTGERLQQTIDRLEVAADLAQMTMLGFRQTSTCFGGMGGSRRRG